MSFLYKVALLGDPVKEQLREKYLGKGFSSNYMTTIGSEFALKEMNIRGRRIKFQIWDLAGHPRYGTTRYVYYYGSLGGLIIYKTGDRDSFKSIKPWLNELWEHNGRGKYLQILLGGVQDDQLSDIITQEEVHDLLQEIQSPIFPILNYIISKGEESKIIETMLNHLGEKYVEFLKSFKKNQMIPLMSSPNTTLSDFSTILSQQTEPLALTMTQKIDSHRNHHYHDGNPFTYAYTIRELEYLVELYEAIDSPSADNLKKSIAWLKNQ
jgi:GTPase SAR1 family protein